MLTQYLTQTAQLLQNPAAPVTLYATGDLIGYINTARYQLAGESGCVRTIGTLPITPSSQFYNFAAVTGLPASVQGIYAIRQITRTSGTGQIYLGSRSYPWAELYWLNNATPVAAAPTEWAQYGNGVTGSIVLNTTPDAAYVLNCDCTCQPIPLVTDATAEAIPYPFQDCVAFLAAWYAYLSAQRQSDADKMYGRYQEYLDRARKISVPNVLGSQYDMTIIAPSAAPQASGGGGR